MKNPSTQGVYDGNKKFNFARYTNQSHLTMNTVKKNPNVNTQSNKDLKKISLRSVLNIKYA